MNDTPLSQPVTGRINLVGLLIGLLGAGTLVFGILTIVAFGKAHSATTTLASQKAAAARDAAAAATKAQKASDDEVVRKATETPFRSFTASADFGGFVINFPKNWSGLDQETVQSQTQVVLSLNPDFIHQTNGQPDAVAAKVTLTQQLTSTLLSSFADQVKSGKLTEHQITVSGITGTDVSGTFTDRKTIRAIYLPVRDKTLIISTENTEYASEFNDILAAAKINP